MHDTIFIPRRALTEYEATEVRAIAAWKSCRPSRLSQLIDTVTAPINWVVGHVVPRSAVATLVSSMETIAARADVIADVAAAAGVSDVRELAGATLEVCDDLARLFTARAERFFVVEGTAAAFGGPLFHVPQQLIAALRSIARVGHCYGYSLNSKADRALVIDILEVAMLQDPVRRGRIVESLHAAMESSDESLADEQDYLTRASSVMLTEEVLELVPVVGEAASFVFDNQFMHAVDETARRVFQEQWLRDRGLVNRIAPDPCSTQKSSYVEVGRALGQALYCLGAVAGFGGSFPCRFIQHAFGAPRNPVGVGARHGSEKAVEDAREFLAGLQESYEKSPQAEGVAATPA